MNTIKNTFNKDSNAGVPQARRSRNRRFDSSRKKENLINHVLSLNWIAAVTKGGKRQRVCAFVIVGDGNGSAGYSLGKAKEVSDAVRKAMDKASRSMFKVSLKEGRTFHHDAEVKYCSTRICLRSAPVGTGIIASEVVRSSLDALGVKDAVVKVIGSNNPHNVVKALFKGVFSMQSPKMIAIKRGISMDKVFGKAEAA
ncbi:30S ribosomal protein S5 [Candidatus Cytomitobacter indipagum]|uniref:Small ribosomal subunit protein uS5 n=1 Tax=Candidatus Cytomitobacter indipagum TaxID=2601575 RepID=A0A5C0UEV0_9PROT|nr:30S ribosomal protein S5 [Candidatus Cytomitobacter indipagum]QEK38230.1 30S ribosomal protein S5 [Candidatus Cytomitobacter indipagum]